ncbi:RDD family protein [Streptomyces sp. NPDC056244]|uniref:RDD family protein n=1 Tax=unclassified Streptomyces TaxID=2593676 RepID=UPI0035D67714
MSREITKKGQRTLAWLLDFALVAVMAVLLGILTFHRISALLTDVPELGIRSAWELFSSRGQVLESAEGLGREMWDSALGYVQQAFAVLVVCTFVYQFATLALVGRTLGKAVVGLRVATVRPERSRRHAAAVRAAVTTVADVACFAVACCLLLAGQFSLSVLCWCLAVVLFWCNALPVALGPGRSAADLLAGTAVVGIQLPQAVTQKAARATQAASQAATQAADLGRATTQGGRKVWEGVRRAADSDVSRATADRGRAALNQARSRWDQRRFPQE